MFKYIWAVLVVTVLVERVNGDDVTCWGPPVHQGPPHRPPTDGDDVTRWGPPVHQGPPHRPPTGFTVFTH
ncbi:unnamed protein product [Leptidea sinapis]|uniref:Secreted protein n=1 Tax=Leptidea sinapis TaxID=189913 RepID=A0A5E4QDY0_9NEOP|nr:unnamed protein product [Leptidea sinapis]